MPVRRTAHRRRSGDGAFGTTLRCIGCAEYGAVLVAGGADQVRLPRLPQELPPPARASAIAGESAIPRARRPARKADGRRMGY